MTLAKTMLCDIAVSKAKFRVTVSTRVDRVYNNEVCPANTRLKWELPFSLVWRNYQIEGKEHALERIVDTLETAENNVFWKLSTVLFKLNFNLEKVEPIEVERWHIVVSEAKGERKTQAIEVHDLPHIDG